MQFTVNPHRFDPYKGFKFRVIWDGRPVAGVDRVSALRRSTEVVQHRDGADTSTVRRSPGRTTFDPITLSRGVTQDPAFEQWANKSWNVGSAVGSEVSLKDYRKDVVIQLLNEAGQVVRSYLVYRAWVSEYQALPELDAHSDTVAIETITLQHEGWERDYAVQEPAEESFTEP